MPPLFPFTIAAYETPSATSEGWTAHNCYDFRDAVRLATPHEVRSYYAYDVTILSPTEVEITYLDMRDNVYGGIGKRLGTGRWAVEAALTRKHIERRAAIVAKQHREAELVAAEKEIVDSYAREIIDSIYREPAHA